MPVILFILFTRKSVTQSSLANFVELGTITMSLPYMGGRSVTVATLCDTLRNHIKGTIWARFPFAVAPSLHHAPHAVFDASRFSPSTFLTLCCACPFCNAGRVRGEVKGAFACLPRVVPPLGLAMVAA